MENDEFPFSNYDWKNKQLIGSGGFGKVYKVKALKSLNEVAIKQIDMANFDADFKMQALKTEIAAMMELSSQNTVGMYEFKFGRKYTYVVLELCESDLKKQLQSHGEKLPEIQCIDIIRQILQGFKVLINKGYIHRDVKPQNILLKNGVYKLADYGFSRKIDIQFEKLREVCGTPFYMSPQLLYQQPYSSKCDIWSLGLLFFEMLFGYFPWSNRHIDIYKQQIISRPISFPYRCGIGHNTKDFIEKCLQLEEHDRFDWKSIFTHELIRTGKAGPVVKDIPVDDNTLRVLIRVQQSSSRKFINAQQLFRKYQKYKKLGEAEFYQLLQDLDPQITSFQKTLIFKSADTSHDGFVDFQEFKQFLLEVDYRPVDDIVSRRIDEMVKMAKARKLDVRGFFNIMDVNKSSQIDYKEFVGFIRHVAPTLTQHDVDLMWHRFDKDKSGGISYQEFVSEITRGVSEQESHMITDYERAKRNLICLKGFLKQKKVTSEQFFGKARLSKHQAMRPEEFGPLIQQINYVITKEEIIDMFRLIDKNQSGTIEIAELAAFLEY